MHSRSLSGVWMCGLFAIAVLTGEKSLPTQSRASSHSALCVSSKDSLSGRPIAHAQVRMGRVGWFVSDTHRDRLWFAYTDSSGKACLDSIPEGDYTLEVCHEMYERQEELVSVGPARSDSVAVNLAWHGPHSGRRCERVFIFDQNRDEVLERWRHGLEAADTRSTGTVRIHLVRSWDYNAPPAAHRQSGFPVNAIGEDGQTVTVLTDSSSSAVLKGLPIGRAKVWVARWAINRTCFPETLIVDTKRDTILEYTLKQRCSQYLYR